MRALSLLTLIFVVAEYTITGGSEVKCKDPELISYAKKPDSFSQIFRMECVDGYVRKAGTSSLFRCEHDDKTGSHSWINDPPLICIPDPSKPVPSIATVKPPSTSLANTQAHTPAPPLTVSTSSTTVTTLLTTTGKTQSTSTTSGQTAITTTPHTVATATEAFHHRTTTKKTTTSSWITISSSTTVKENLTILYRQFVHSAINSTMTEAKSNGTNQATTSTASGIAAGTILAFIVVLASIAGVLLWCRRSRQREDISAAVEMNLQPPSFAEPLLPCSVLSNSSQNPKSPPSLNVQNAYSFETVKS